MPSGGKKSKSPPPEPHYLDSHPSDQSLIEYLRHWVLGTAARKPAFIHEADLYAAGPAERARTFAPAISHDGERAWYFLTRLRLKNVHGRGRRFARTVDTGAGWWHSEAKDKPVVDVLAGGHQVGLRQFFSFMTYDQSGKRVRTGWIMAELSLVDDDGRGGCGARREEEDLRVMCKVYRSPRHRGDELGKTEPASAKGGGRTDATADDDESSATITDALACGRKAAEGDCGAEESPARGERKGKAAEDDCSAEAPPARRELKGKAAADDGESSAVPPRKRRTADDSTSHTSKIYCPRCGLGFHIDAAQTDLVEGGDTGDSTQGEHKFYHFL